MDKREELKERLIAMLDGPRIDTFGRVKDNKTLEALESIDRLLMAYVKICRQDSPSTEKETILSELREPIEYQIRNTYQNKLIEYIPAIELIEKYLDVVYVNLVEEK